MKLRSSIKHSSSSLRTRISLSVTFFVACIGIIIALLSSYLYTNYLQKSILQTAQSNLQLIADNIDREMNTVKKLAQFCQVNTMIGEFTEAGASLSNQEIISTYERLNEEYYANESRNYIHRIIVASHDGTYLQIVPTSYSSSIHSPSVATALPYFTQLFEASDYSFHTGMLQDPFYRGSLNKSVLLTVRPIYSRYYSDSTGWVLLCITPDLFSDQLAYYNLPADSSLFLSLGEHQYYITKYGCPEADVSFRKQTRLNVDYLQNTTEAFYVYEKNSLNQTLMLRIALTELPGCYVSQTISDQEFGVQRTLFLSIVLCLLLLVIGIGIIIYRLLYNTISVPVQQLQHQIEDISRGNFTRNTSIEWKHELGDIGRGINDMSDKIRELLEHVVEEEREKQDLEYKMLQSQINPHFLYNTLNSIKWMASIQGAEGIAEMTTSLSRLLKSISKGTKILVPLKEELSLLEDYFTIQKYRYGGTITLNTYIEDDSLLKNSIVKFTLQPLVENSIFHGIEPKGTAGHIDISIRKENDTELIIEVLDDGVGMNEEQIQQLLTEGLADVADKGSEFFRGFGIRNVHKRLQYEFGPSYGISVESKEGQFTKMILLIPITEGKEDTDV